MPPKFEDAGLRRKKAKVLPAKKARLSDDSIGQSATKQTQDEIDRAANAMVPDRDSENRINLEKAQYLVKNTQQRFAVATIELEAATIEVAEKKIELAKAQADYDD